MQAVRKQRRGVGISLVLAVLLAGLAWWRLGTCHAAPQRFEVAAFDTVCAVTVYSFPEKKESVQAAMREILAMLRALHDSCNVYDAGSEAAKMNASASNAPWHCSEVLWNVLAAAREAWLKTDGAFDVTIGPLMALWRDAEKKQLFPSDAEIAERLQLVGLGRVRFDEEKRTVFFPMAGMRMDFGGIVKGLALDRTAAILQEHGLNCFSLDFGGNLLFSRVPPPGEKDFLVGIRDPAGKGRIGCSFRVLGMAVATSGNYERSGRLGKQRIGHVMDPRTGRPAAILDAVTVVTSRGVDSDVFSTALFVAPALALPPESRVYSWKNGRQTEHMPPRDSLAR